ncbi:hypothetical protein OTK49_20695 [Vibrio coralliirubri]|uniref:hypothetical protein n=1 Tax=Vibrio coralliirubri TaxID=1516159 RepID=UPI00228522AB|nr:hypothetical protein [Vibrio coralliirubri]MCY9864937.1 hypothetical protein [Vibrio coralliirubri]
MSYIKIRINQTDASNILSGASFFSQPEIEKLKDVSREMSYSPRLKETINTISLTPSLIKTINELCSIQPPSHRVWYRMNNLITKRVSTLTNDQREALGLLGGIN